jgi:hypothetical protein
MLPTSDCYLNLGKTAESLMVSRMEGLTVEGTALRTWLSPGNALARRVVEPRLESFAARNSTNAWCSLGDYRWLEATIKTAQRDLNVLRDRLRYDIGYEAKNYSFQLLSAPRPAL